MLAHAKKQTTWRLPRELRACWPAVVGIALFSALINALYLTGSFYMLQVYDRVLPSRSIPTLVALSILAATLYGIQAAIDACRSRILVRLARLFDETVSPRVFEVVAALPLTGRGGSGGLQPLRDVDQIRSFLAGGGPLGFLDLPWIPFYLLICFLFHPLIGLAALCGALALIVIAFLSETMTRSAMQSAAGAGAARYAIAEAVRCNAEVVSAMGMTASVGSLWKIVNDRHLETQTRTSDVGGGLSALSKAMRMALQSGVLGLGAYLVIEGSASAGVIIAGSILSARAVAPVEQVIAHWKGFVAARQSFARLRTLMTTMESAPPALRLQAPRNSLSVEALTIVPPGSNRVVLKNVSFTLQAGDAIGVIGPSASGKSTLARALVGVWKPSGGCVRLDGAAIDQWDPTDLGRSIGYMPQDVFLFDGTIAQNIARFDPDADDVAVIRAAEQAGVHETIVRLPKGYDTIIGEKGLSLSGGQRQRIALARAFYGQPFLIVLDEPNSNLDAAGEQALTGALATARAWGAIVVVIAHRPSALAGIENVLVLSDGVARASGPKDEVLRGVVRAV
jgi:ATP-binding cassette subfamily C protein PrsD